MNRKGTVQDVGVAMVFFFIAVIIFFIVTYSYGEVVDRLVNNTQINSSAAAVQAFQESKALTERLDYVSVVLLFGLILAIIITGWFVGGNQLFAFIYFLVLVILIMASAILSFVWHQVSTKGMFALTLTKFPISNFLLDNFPMVITIIGFIGMMVMFAKPYFQGDQ